MDDERAPPGRRYSPTDDLQHIRAVAGNEVDFSAPERWVMVALLLHRNGETGRMDPSVPRIMRFSGLGRSTVLQSLAALEERGVLDRDRTLGKRTSYALRSSVTRPAGGPVQQVDPSESRTPPVQEMDGTRPGDGPERTKERTKERTNGVARDLWSVFVEVMGGDRLTLTPKRRRLLELLHEEHLAGEPDPLEVFRATLAAVRASDHHMSERAYQMPESLFRNAERRERWAEKGRALSGRDTSEGDRWRDAIDNPLGGSD